MQLPKSFPRGRVHDLPKISSFMSLIRFIVDSYEFIKPQIHRIFLEIFLYNTHLILDLETCRNMSLLRSLESKLLGTGTS